MTDPSPLRVLVSAEAASAVTHPVDALTAAARARFPGAVAVLFYGSCRRTEQRDGLFDLYVLLEGYRSLPFVERLLARALPPNVYYLESSLDASVLRAKCTVISLADFERGTSARWFHSYLWGRFAQPVTLAWSRDSATRARVDAALERAVMTFVANAAALVPENAEAEDLWVAGLAMSYSTELRSEGAERARELYRANAPYFDAAARAARSAIRASHSGVRRSRAAWAIRRVTGKLLSILRVLKSAYTFDGGLDYLVWKLERHSGRRIEVPDAVRRAPAIHLWGFFWRLYRDGVFR
jgi:hypothetical protein